MPVQEPARGIRLGNQQLTAPAVAHTCLFVYQHSLPNGLAHLPVSAAPVDERPGIMIERKASFPSKGSPRLQDSQGPNIPCGGTLLFEKSSQFEVFQPNMD